MNTKRVFPILSAVLLLAASLACNAPTKSIAIPSPTPETPAAQPPAAPTPTATTEKKPSNGVPISFSGTNFTIPTGIATGGGPQTVTAMDDQNGPGWDVAPAHLKFSLENYPLNGTMHYPAIYVYPAQEYEAVSGGAAESQKRLRALTSGVGMDVNNDTAPFVPFFNAAQTFEAQAMPLKFQNGAGIRMVAQYDQAFMPINNYELIYHFEGLTSDGKYYIIAIFPTTLPTLATENKYDAPIPAGGISFNQDDPAAYYKAITEQLNAVAPETFIPNLTTLDALIQSLKVVAP